MRLTHPPTIVPTTPFEILIRAVMLRRLHRVPYGAKWFQSQYSQVHSVLEDPTYWVQFPDEVMKRNEAVSIPRILRVYAQIFTDPSTYRGATLSEAHRTQYERLRTLQRTITIPAGRNQNRIDLSLTRSPRNSHPGRFSGYDPHYSTVAVETMTIPRSTPTPPHPMIASGEPLDLPSPSEFECPEIVF